jgi:hypothetical protein
MIRAEGAGGARDEARKCHILSLSVISRRWHVARVTRRGSVAFCHFVSRRGDEVLPIFARRLGTWREYAIKSSGVFAMKNFFPSIGCVNDIRVDERAVC